MQANEVRAPLERTVPSPPTVAYRERILPAAHARADAPSTRREA